MSHALVHLNSNKSEGQLPDYSIGMKRLRLELNAFTTYTGPYIR